MKFHTAAATALSAVVLVFSQPLVAKDYDLPGMNCYHGTFNPVGRVKGDWALNFTIHGAVMYDDKELPFQRMSIYCAGIVASKKGDTESKNYCEQIDADGDKIFITVNGKGSDNSGTFDGGTGKFEGATGTFTSETLGRWPNAAEGNFIGCRRHHHKLTLPD